MAITVIKYMCLHYFIYMYIYIHTHMCFYRCLYISRPWYLLRISSRPPPYHGCLSPLCKRSFAHTNYLGIYFAAVCFCKPGTYSTTKVYCQTKLIFNHLFFTCNLHILCKLFALYYFLTNKGKYMYCFVQTLFMLSTIFDL